MRAAVHDLKRAFGEQENKAQHPLLIRYLDTNGDGTGTKLFTETQISQAAFIAPGAGEIFVLHRMMVAYLDDTATAAVYGGLGAALSNGIQIKHKRGATVVANLTDNVPVKKNADWVALAGVDVRNYDWGNPANPHAVGVRWTFTRAGQAITLIGDQSDSLVVELNDNFTGLDDHRFVVQGYRYR